MASRRSTQNDPLLAEFVGAELIVRVTVTETFINCPRYVHKYQRVQTSKYAPQSRLRCSASPAMETYRCDSGCLASHARRRSPKELGGIITFEEYGALVIKSEG